MKRLLALALMVTVLAGIGTTAAAGPISKGENSLEVAMGDRFEPDGGWHDKRYGEQERPYQGKLPFDTVTLAGTRDGGVCRVEAHVGAFNLGIKINYFIVEQFLIRSYGRPTNYDEELSGRLEEVRARWLLTGHVSNLKKIELYYRATPAYRATPPFNEVSLTFDFENIDECLEQED